MTSLSYYAMCLAVMMSCTGGKVIDLSHKHSPSTIMSIHGAPGYNLTNLYKGENLFGLYLELNYYGSSEHGGTHMDAPSHFTKGGVTIDEIPIENTIAEGVMIDCSKEAAANINFAVKVSKIEEWEKINGEIPRDAAVLFYFGWYTKYDNEALYRGTTDVGNSKAYIYPYLSLNAAQWLVDKRNVRILGSDTLTVERFPSPTSESVFGIHKLILQLNKTLIENLRDLEKLPARNFRFHASPVKYVGASGAQIRAYAMTYDSNYDNGVDSIQVSAMIVSCLYLLVLALM